MSTMVDVRHLFVRFGDFTAVRDVSFTVEKGEIFGFLGANGAGKTTTIRVLCGLLLASEGRVFIDNEELIAGHESLIKSKVGYMSQHFTLYDDLSIRENMDFAASLRHMNHAEYLKNRRDLLDFIGFNEDLTKVVRDLPTGIKQEIALCVSLLHQPKIVFLDEPTAGVAPVARHRFWELIKKLVAQGKTIFVTTHYMDEAENCGRIALMRSGELIALDSPANLKQNTFHKQLYHLSPITTPVILPDRNLFDIWEPYGQNYHAVFKNDTDISIVRKHFNIQKISPSLEDVFIQLVEGQTR